MNELALFCGAGGGLLGTRLLKWRPVCGVELDAYAREVLLRRQDEGHIEPFPIWDDVRTFDGKPWRGIVDVVTAGFPCQPFSCAGKRLDERDSRNLWPEAIRIIREVAPTYCLLENVPRLLRTAYFGTIIGNLSDAGYDAAWSVVSAAECGAPHLRKRLWIFADANGHGQSRRSQQNCAPGPATGTPQRNNAVRLRYDVSHASVQRLDTRRNAYGSNDGDELSPVCEEVSDTAAVDFVQESLKSWQRSPTKNWWKVEPEMGRVVDGLAYRVDQLRAIGNGQVPAVVARAWRQLTGGCDG